MFEYMIQAENGKLKNKIRRILEECGIPDFDDNDYTFICEMIDDPKDLDLPVRKTFKLLLLLKGETLHHIFSTSYII